jgi:hypothetical protein
MCGITVTLEAYMDIYSKLVGFVADNASGVPLSTPPPPDLTKKALSLQVRNKYMALTPRPI